MDALRVVIADDHPALRIAVRAALEADGFVVVADVDSGPLAVLAVVEHRPDICLLDVVMPGGGGIDAARVLSEKVPETAVIMLTASAHDDDLFDSLRAGARGYLLKDVNPDRLGAALRGVLDGEAALPRTLVAKVIAALEYTPSRTPSARVERGQDGLTRKECEVLELMADGLSTEQIAARLYISQVTVRTHVAHVLQKLQVVDRQAAIRHAREKRRRT